MTQYGMTLYQAPLFGPEAPCLRGVGSALALCGPADEIPF